MSISSSTSPDAALQFFGAVIKRILPSMSAATFQYLLGATTVRTLVPDEVFIRAGRPHQTIGFVAEGFLRGYYINQQGEEVTTRFAADGGFATHYGAFINDAVSKYTFHALEPCTLVCLSRGALQKGYATCPDLEKFGRLIAESVVNILERRQESFQFLDATARYREFERLQPNVLQRVSVKHLASYLGVTRPSLSRIRGALARGEERG